MNDDDDDHIATHETFGTTTKRDGHPPVSSVTPLPITRTGRVELSPSLYSSTDFGETFQ